MIVRTWKTIEVDLNVDVDLDMFIDELAQRRDEALDEKSWRGIMAGMDAITRIMKTIPDDVFKRFPDESLTVLADRLREIADRLKRHA